MNNSEKLVLVTAIFAIAVGVFSGLSLAVTSLNIATVPDWALPIINGALNFFTATPVIIILAYFRNLLGFLRNWITKAKGTAVDYDLLRFRNTIATYFAFIGPFVAAVPAPYNAIAYPFAVIADIVISEFNKILNPPELAKTLAPT